MRKSPKSLPAVKLCAPRLRVGEADGFAVGDAEAVVHSCVAGFVVLRCLLGGICRCRQARRRCPRAGLASSALARGGCRCRRRRGRLRASVRRLPDRGRCVRTARSLAVSTRCLAMRGLRSWRRRTPASSAAGRGLRCGGGAYRFAAARAGRQSRRLPRDRGEGGLLAMVLVGRCRSCWTLLLKFRSFVQFCLGTDAVA